MELNIVNIGLTIGGLIIANYGIKFGRVYPLIKKSFVLAKNQEEARRDGKLTEKEKAGLYDDIEVLLKEAYLIMKGLLPNKSKK